MRHGWDHGGGAGWWWLPQLLFMALAAGALVWLVLTLVRRTPAGPAAPLAPPPAAPSPQDVLAMRLARGEIEPDDYRARLEVLQGTPPPAQP